MAKYQLLATGVYEYFLILNPMMSNTESVQEFGPFLTREEVLEFYNSHKVDPYIEEGPDLFGNVDVKTYSKCFAKGSCLEWMNPLKVEEFEIPGYYGHGIHEVLVTLENIQKHHQIT